MDIRPAPVQRVGNDRDSRRGLRLAVLPLAALFVVVGGAWAGALLPQVPGGDPALAPDAFLQPGEPPSTAGVERLPTSVPTRALGLAVRTGSQLRAERATGSVGSELVAVAGNLRSAPLPLRCPAMHLSLSQAFCHRLAALFPARGVAIPGGTSSTAIGASDTQLAGHLLPGTGVPARFAPDNEAGVHVNESVPVVLIGRFEDPRAPACGTGQAWCRDDFAVELVAWAAGRWLEAPVVSDRDPALAAVPVDGRRLGAITRRAATEEERIISLAVVQPRLLAVIDPQAFRSAANSRRERLWYVRSIVVPVSGRAQVAWTVIEDGTGVLLGYSWPQP